ncbi:MAG: ClpXP protease specificity-enhancing factor [Pseudomonadota bacterium]
MPDISTKPYMLRAIYEWCTDSGFTAYLAVKVDAATTVPMEYVKKGEIVLNISFGATSGLKMDNDAIHFHARFGGVSREIYVPVHNVLAIYANENGQGMAFDVTATASEIPAAPHDESALASVPSLSSVPSTTAESITADMTPTPDDPNEPPKKGGRPTLTRIK